jgi:hypothetical protein
MMISVGVRVVLTNLDKYCSELFIHCSDTEKVLVEQELRCPVSTFPLGYLGLPLALRKPSAD